MIPQAAELLQNARSRAGLSQRDLARRAGTTQSVVVRIEQGLASPSWRTLTRLLRCCGFHLVARLEPRPARRSHMLRDVERILRLTPEQRLEEVRNLSRFTNAARRA